jgi:nicotinamidase-related amidase
VHIDLANAWTRPGHAFSCDGMETIIPAVQALNEAGRAKGIPVVYTTTAYQDVDGPNSDMGLWVHKIPVELLQAGTEAVEIDSRIAPAPGELVLVKKRASGFHGTPLSSYLNAQGVDTAIITGVTMAGCVRHTAEDAIAEGFRPIIVREAVGDRVPGVVEWKSLRHRREVRRRRAARAGAVVPRRDRSVHQSRSRARGACVGRMTGADTPPRGESRPASRESLRSPDTRPEGSQ